MQTTDSPTLELAIDLISRASVTPDDAGCQALMMSRLASLGFTGEHMRFGDTDNLWARKGSEGPLLTFAGHTDVVPTGPEKNWAHPPFDAVIKDGYLLGRGAADMKGSLAAFITACERFVSAHPDHRGSIALLITSDEEGPAQNGTVKVIEALEARSEKIDWCLIGEPSSTREVGDVIKNGRRGSLHGYLTVQGIQGHVAYPHLAENAVHTVAPALDALANEFWDNGNDYFPPTTFQITKVEAGTGSNIIPGECLVHFNFRYCTENTAESLEKRVLTILDRHSLKYDLQWHLSGRPFLTDKGALVAASQNAIRNVTGRETELSTSGGTSDGRFIAPTGAQVVELGPINATIHKIDECVKAEDLDTLSLIYEQILVELLV
ncbi:MAG TPA: succinyl-diaminopimelate desuccinylase [Marinobacter sp.]|uniref:Succinyl-diaminopimelate desuccinylase n=2 Tax=root TaxID=1 RepID=A0A831R896_9GAMM|nr:succinyl-diaminopimelate desuccinylase [Marinobacter antarcticus]HDZ37769.1 succinyl-diaminopimelate desuccinylase [Marinobacter sp.]HEA54054.1 succinyl-diaminopimelate desuccinylase [Marinobacter antarcticus]